MFNEISRALTKYKNSAAREYKTHQETTRTIRDTYAPAVAKELMTEESKNFSRALSVPRSAAKKAVSLQINKARRYINHQLSHVDAKAISEINALRGLPLSASEISILQEKYNGGYWTQKTLNAVLNEQLPPTAQIPDINPDVQLAALDKLESDLLYAIDGFDGSAMNSTPEAAACERILSGASLAVCADALNQNAIFSEDHIEQFYKPLSSEEDRGLYKKFFLHCRNDEDKRSKAAELAALGHGEVLERSERFSKYLPAEYERVTGVQFE